MVDKLTITNLILNKYYNKDICNNNCYFGLINTKCKRLFLVKKDIDNFLFNVTSKICDYI